MSNTSKWLMLFALFTLAGSTLAACSTLPNRQPPLRATLSALETLAARLEVTAAPSASLTAPAAQPPTVPKTGPGETEIVVIEPPLPIEEPPLTDLPLQLNPTLTGVPADGQSPETPVSPTPDCPTHESIMTLSASKTKLKVGEAIEVKVLLENTGCVTLGLPQYRLAILNSEGKPIFSPDKPDPVVHSLGVPPGRSDEASYLLQAVSPGKATISAVASFEVHLGYPGPAYWGTGSAKELVIEVAP